MTWQPDYLKLHKLRLYNLFLTASLGFMQILISTRPGGFSLSQECLDELFSRAPEFFDGPFETDSFSTAGVFELSQWPNAVLHEGGLFFLLTSHPGVRQDPMLLHKLQTKGSAALVGPYCSSLKAVEVPDGVAWHIFEYEDGSEAVHENHRVWS